jgi:hypothetical protein
LPLSFHGGKANPLTRKYREAAAAKAAEAARRKAERDALEAEEMAALKSAKGAGGNGNTAGKARGGANKSTTARTTAKRGLDLSQLDAGAAAAETTSAEEDDAMSASALNASGIDNALDALSLATGAGGEAIERHPERRFRAAYAAFEARRLEEMRGDKSLRRQQKMDLVRKEFEKSPENPFNQVSARFNATREQVAEIRGQEKGRIEARLGSPTSPGGAGL